MLKRKRLKPLLGEIKFTVPQTKKIPKSPEKYIGWLIQKNSQSLFVKQHGLELFEIPRMVGALIYHFKNFKRIEKRAANFIAPFINHNSLNDIISSSQQDFQYRSQLLTLYLKARYEKAAYLGALGKLAKTFTSEWCSQNSKTIANTIPTILALLPLRHKVDAHRSYDDPRAHEKNALDLNQPDSQILSQIRSHLSCNIINKWRGQCGHNGSFNLTYEILIGLEDRSPYLKENALGPVNGVEVPMNDKGYHIMFNLSRQHEIIIQESINFIKQILS